MTDALWVCPRCGSCFILPIYAPFTKCPNCHATFKLKRFIRGAHKIHEIPIMVDPETGLEFVPIPIALLVGRERAFREYMSLVNNYTSYLEKKFKGYNFRAKCRRLFSLNEYSE